MHLIFKTAAKEDIPAIAQLAKDIWHKHYADIIDKAQIEYMLKKMYSEEKLLQQIAEGHIFTIVYADNKPAGYISISSKNGKNYFLHKFYIEVANHGKGIGSQLFANALQQMNNPETIELTVNRKNYKAINFYFKNGFVIKEVADFDIGNGYFMNDFVMIKKC